MDNEEDEAQKQMKETRELLLSQSKRAIELRSKDREFHGLEREFQYHQAQMLVDYEQSKDLKHPRDLGDAREHILRDFLRSGGYLPDRYAVSERSARVVSTSGHISNEIDIALYDPLNSLTLMKREDVYEVYPIESVYGVIQVKSRLNKREIREGLANIASFKQLDRPPVPPRSFIVQNGPSVADRGFGLLFAYDTDLEWLALIAEIEAFATEHLKRLWANAIFVLSKGLFLHGEDSRARVFNSEIEAIGSLRMHGRPDLQNICLFEFQSILLALLRNTEVHPAEIDRYFRLPLIADTHSYAFTWGMFAEVGTCERHGDFPRKIAPEQLEKLIACCRATPAMNWIRAIDIAYGRPENEEAYRRQPGKVYIYNPENLALSEILVRDTMFQGKPVKSLAFDAIETAGMNIFVPYYYSDKEGIISGCPKCQG